MWLVKHVILAEKSTRVVATTVNKQMYTNTYNKAKELISVY